MCKRRSAWISIIAVAMIVTGVTLGCVGARSAFTPYLTRYTMGDRGIGVGDVRVRLPAALNGDRWLIAAYGLVLVGCAVLFRARCANSRAGRNTGDFVVAAGVVAVLADLSEDGLLLMTMTQLPERDWLRTATAAAAIIKFCAMLVAAVSLPASLGILLRGAMGMYRAWAWDRRHRAPLSHSLRQLNLRSWKRDRKKRNPLIKPWWEGVLAPPDEPVPTATDAAVETSGEPVEALIDKQQMWIRAYNVPGINAALENRVEPLRALCLSGGGVRSACVAMGAMQAFSRASSAIGAAAQTAAGQRNQSTLLDSLDFVVSVSGGGYAAGARLLAVQPQQVDLRRTRKPGRQIRANVALLSGRFNDGSAEFDHLRRGSSYIADSPLGLIRALVQVLKNLLASLATVLIIPVIAGWLLGLLLAELPIAAFPPVPAERPADQHSAHPDLPWAYTETELKIHSDYFQSLVAQPAAYWAAGLFAFAAVLSTMVALLIEWRRDSPTSERWRARMTRMARGCAGFALIVFTLTIALPGLMRLCWWANSHTPPTPGSALGALSGVVGINYLAALIAMVWRDKKKLSSNARTQRNPSFLRQLLPPAVASQLLTVLTLTVLLTAWLALLGSFAASVFHQNTQNGWGPQLTTVPHQLLWLIGLVIAAGFIAFADVTSLSLHPFYRRRLARTFAVRRMPDSGPNEAVPYPSDEPTWLPVYGRVTTGPKFVFACAATIAGRDKPAPGLNAVSYVMSADYIGGPELGWFDAPKLLDVAPPRIRRDLTVQAAVAISGAAFASAMGRQNKGLEKLLAISGARLGTWLPNPHFVSQLCDGANDDIENPGVRRRAWANRLPTVRGAGYLYREILGINGKEARLVQVTDGGHYDNSGLVEALRRRCRLIFVIDGGGDPPPLASGLTDALRLAKYELGVDVTLQHDGPYSIEGIAPGSGAHFDGDDALASLNTRITRSAVVAGTITYPAAAGLPVNTGTLIFAKAVLVETCPYWLLTYAASNKIFPHDPTSDQWFNEAQFAAYTALGNVIAAEAFKCLEYVQNMDAAE